MLFSIPDSNLLVLEALGTYKFLTVPQMVRLEVNTHEQSVQRTLRRFKEKKRFTKLFVDKKDFGFIAGRGNLHSIYYLTDHGAKVLAEYWRVDPSTIHYPKREPDFGRDYFHRRYTVDVHISLRQWADVAGAEVKFVHTYFDYVGSNRSKKKNPLRNRTRIDLDGDRFFVPDMVYLVTRPDGSQDLAVVEIHNTKDTKRFLEQMENHALAVQLGAVAEAYSLAINNRIRWVFSHDSTMHAAMKRIGQHRRFAALHQLVEFNTVKGVREDFTAGWRHF